MPAIHYQVTVQVTGGPKMTVARTLAVEAYDVVDVAIPADSSASVEIEPAAAAGRVKLMLLTADTYEDLEYELDGTAHALDGPALLVGEGAVALLDATPGTIEFTNAHPTDVRPIHVLVGRAAVAP
jgi:hypothetical protein